MKTVAWIAKVAFVVTSMATALIPEAAFAYTLKGAGCDGNGQECQVFCDNGTLAGSMYWNGSYWTDGVKWDKSKDTQARKICAANGTDCK